jgi:dTDP-4-amino-4,6-dideoxygalactose transaminase
MLNTPFSPWPCYTVEEANAVSSVLLSNKVNYWTGEEGRAFEKEFAQWCNSNYAVAVSNGTVALDLALMALDLPPGGEVIVTSRTFIASVSAIVNAGLRPVFADVDTDTQNISVETIANVLSSETCAILCVHLAGLACDMDPILELAKERKLAVIEDCAQAHGAEYKGRSVGSLGDVACWSFCQDKIMTTGGEGGMVTTNSESVWRRVWSLKDHGKNWDKVYLPQKKQAFRWVHDSFGTNGRMTEMQAAIGRLQLLKMPSWHRARTNNANRIISACRELKGLYVPEIKPEFKHAWYKCYVYVCPEELSDGWSRDRIVSAIVSAGVPCYSGSCSEVYLEEAFTDYDFTPSPRLCGAKKLGETSLMFLVHPTLKPEEIEKTVNVISSVMCEATI